MHLLGILRALGGQLDSAVDLIRQAVQLNPGLAEAWTNLGCVLVHRGKVDEAIAAYTQAGQLSPSRAGAHYALGLLLQGQGRLDEAIAAFSRATQSKPDYAEAHFKLGMALRSKGRLDEAIAAYSKAIELKPDLPDAHNNLANVLRDKRLLDEAIAEYTKAVQLNPNDFVAQLNLGNSLSQKARIPEAVVAYQRAIQLKPDHFEAHNKLGLTLANMQRFDEALEAHRRALALRPDDARGHETLGETLLVKHDMAEAAASFRRALALSPASASTWNGLGVALQALGEFEEASDCFRRGLAISPDKPFFHKNLVTTSGQEADEMEIQRLRRLLHQSDLPLLDRVDAGFALGKLLDDSDRFDDAFASFAQVNELLKQTPATAEESFDADKLHRGVDQMMRGFSTQFFAQVPKCGETSELPVFIVGMPRSGTTLVEQIAASHPAIFGAGELKDIARISLQLASAKRPSEYGSADEKNPAVLRRVCDTESIANASREHLQYLRSLAGTALRVTDKMPGNVFHLALIALLFPAARVIFCRRDARDTCLSCYFQRFANRGLRYTYDLADCGRQWLETDRLMNHWLKVLPLRMLEIHYEEMVADQEGQSRRLIDFLGLPWDPACLEFHKTKRPVVTASVWQVRQPIYTRSVGRWRHYERHLGPLLDVLAIRTGEQVSNLSSEARTESGRSFWETEGFFRQFSMESNPRVAALIAGNANPRVVK